MDLLEDFNHVRNTFSELGHIGERFDSVVSEDADHAVGPTPSASYDRPALTVETTVRQAARGRGSVLAVASAAHTILLATSKGYLIRYHWDESGTEKVTEVEVTRQAEVRVQHVFLDPGGHHTLITTRSTHGSGSSNGSSETYYLHSSWAKPRALSKLRGVAVTAVAWEKQPGEDAADFSGDVLLGTDQGALYCQQLDGRLKKDAAPQLLLDWKDGRKTLTGLEQELLEVPGPGGEAGRRLVLAATPGALYMAVGGPGLHGIFSRFPTAAAWEPLVEVGVSSLNSQIHLIRGSDPTSLPSRFAWLVGGLLCHGHLLLPSTSTSSRSRPGSPAMDSSSSSKAAAAAAAAKHAAAGSGGGGSSSWVSWVRQQQPQAPQGDLAEVEGEVEDPGLYVGDMRQLWLGGGGEVPTTPEEEPICLMPSEFHYLLLYPDRLAAINQVSGKVVSEIRTGLPGATPAGATSFLAGFGGIMGVPLQLLRDAGTGMVVLATNEALHEVALSNEGKDMWRIYLDHQDYDSALKLASGPAQRDVVYRTMAEEAAAGGNWRLAASTWGKITGGRPGFEDLVLQLVEAGDPEALQLFLETKLKVLAPSDKAQSTLVASWLTELLLDRLNRTMMEAGGGRSSSSVAQQTQHLRDFLSNYSEVLDVSTTANLLATYGRLDELQLYASLRGDYEALLDLVMAAPGGAIRALGVLRKPKVSTALVYKYAPALLAAAPQETVDFWVQCSSGLEPRLLLPALVRFGEPGVSEDKRQHVLRYVMYAIRQLQCEDRAVHNLAVALHSLDDDEQPLLTYLAVAKNPLGRPLYDPKYALRLVTERGKSRACVALLCQLGLYQDAVALALAVDLQLAKAVANSPEGEGEEGLRRQLWLGIAQHVVQGGSQGGSEPNADPSVAIKQAVQLLQEAGGLLKIEDILPFFPDFVVIDHFQAAICDSLQRYNRQIEELKQEMDEATDIAEAIRRDLQLLSTRTATLSPQEACAVCHQPITAAALNQSKLPNGGAIPPFYVFPSRLAFHTLCAAEQVIAFGGDGRKKAVTQLLRKLSRVPAGALTVRGDGGTETSVSDLLGQLEEQVGGEDPWNGELTVRMIDVPLVDPIADAMEAASWKI